MACRFILAILLFNFLLGACHQAEPASKPDFLAANIDTTVNPSQDFFLYANGGWIKKTAIPDAESGWGVGDLVQEEIYDKLRKINDSAAAEKAPDGSVTQKIGDFWFSGMDSGAIEKAALSPLKGDFDLISSVKTTDELLKVAAIFHTKGIRVLFGDNVSQDDKNSEVMAYQLGQGGLGLPNRDYYFNTDQRTVAIRKTYQKYLYRTFFELDHDSAISMRKADAVFQLESRLAKASRKLVDLRDPYKNYNKMSVGGLKNLSPSIDWADYLQGVGIEKLDSAIIGQPEFYVALGKEIKSTPLEIWKNYLQFHLIRASASWLDSLTDANYFELIKSFTGAKEQRARWKRVMDAEERAMGEALGQLFVKQYFNEAAKQRYISMVEGIRDAYKDRIGKLTWMSDSTKQKAYEKLSKISKKVGYPDKWKDFSAMKIDRGPFILNVQRANQWWHHYSFSKLGKPVDRTEWDMSPQTYNAYYNPSNNEIVLPAGIFSVPGMRDEDLDDAFVYGYAAASTIGHEITHGFDDQGRQYDENGNLKNWWQANDSVQFVKRAQKIINQFNPVDTLHVNGSATQGENIADLGGLLLGLDAFKKTDAFKKGEQIGGLTQIQRYFLGYAYGWLYQERKERLANQVMTDVHSPAKERVNGPVVNVPEFYDAFAVKPGTKMYRDDSLRVNIW